MKSSCLWNRLTEGEKTIPKRFGGQLIAVAVCGAPLLLVDGALSNTQLEKWRGPASEIVQAIEKKIDKNNHIKKKDQKEEPKPNPKSRHDSGKMEKSSHTLKETPRDLAQTNHNPIGNNKEVTLEMCRKLNDEELAQQFLKFVALGGLLGSQQITENCQARIQQIPIFMIDPLEEGLSSNTLKIKDGRGSIKVEKVQRVLHEGQDTLGRKITFIIQPSYPRKSLRGEVTIFRPPFYHPENASLEEDYKRDVMNFGCVTSRSPIKIENQDHSMFVFESCLIPPR